MVDRRRRVLTERKRKLNIRAFETDAGTITARVSEFIDWAARRYPGQVMTYEEITQAVHSLSRLPAPGSEQVRPIRGAIASARKHCRKHFDRDIVTVRGVGVRGTTSNIDMASSSLVPAAVRAKRAGDSVRELHGMISTPGFKAEIAQAPPEMRENLTTLADWFTDDLGKFLRYLEQKNPRALLPPPPPPPSKE